jgi:xanthine dehydrogenase small subunit
MSEPARHPSFLLDGEIVEARDATPTTTLLEYLRGPLRRCGTKEGCAEGDCGACTVVLGEPRDGSVRYRAVNSCIRFVGTLDGKEVVTVESLRAPDGTLHPVQQAMVECHASQCGFCTPGFVMSLFALWLNRESVTREEAVESLAGNLCRCTGYRPIIDAAMRMHALGPSAHWPRERARDPAPLGAPPPASSGVSIPGFRAPRTLAALAEAYAAAPDSLLLAGGTDVGLWVTKQLRDLPAILYLGDIPELARIEVQRGREAPAGSRGREAPAGSRGREAPAGSRGREAPAGSRGREAPAGSNDVLEIGAAAALTDALAVLVKHYPGLAEVANRFGSPPVRNAGTLCGNIANGSPIGDSMPALIALGAEVVLRRGPTERTIALEDLYAGYRQTTLARGEMVRAVRIPLPVEGRAAACYKISKRFDQDISAVCGGFAVTLRGGIVAEARIAYGGMAAIPKRAAAAEAALTGRPFAAAAVRAAIDALGSDFQPIDDFRASSAYRLRAAGALLERFAEEHGGAPPAGETRVREFSFGTAA